MDVPEQIGRYRVERLLGQGGMALVFLAQDPLIHRHVAVKVLPAQWVLSEVEQKRFHNEARTIATLEHPAIVPIYDFGEHEGQPYLVMRYMPGGSLRQRLHRPLSLPETSRILTRLAEALDHAHAKGIIHRDLKPDNVLFDAEQLPYLADFGIARLAEATKSLTITGTPAYMSPEQVEGNRKLDGRSDLYALGVVLFEMLTGRAPFQADTPVRLMYQHVYEPVPNPCVLNAQLPAGCTTIISRAMAKEPNQRYPRAADMARAVTALSLGTPPAPALAPTEMELPPVKTQMRTRWRLLLPLISGLFILCAGAALMRGLAGGVLSITPTLPIIPSSPLVAAELPTTTATAEPTETSPPSVPASDTVTSASTSTATPAVPTPTPTVSNSPPADPTAGQVWVRPGDGVPMVYVPGGEFVMGSDDATISQAHTDCITMFNADACPFRWFSDEGLPHSVTLEGFWMEQTEVTTTQFAAFLNAQGNREEEGVTWLDATATDGLIIQQAGRFLPRTGFADHPATEITYHGAVAYCTWIGGRLPTEAQWEYAARGPEGRIFPWGNSFDGSRLNYCDVRCADSWRDTAVDDGYAHSAPVGSYPAGASWAGVLDLAGNVWEWVHDWYDPGYYAQSPPVEPAGPAVGSASTRAMRGGSWDTVHFYLRGANRADDESVVTLEDGGLRCVMASGG